MGTKLTLRARRMLAAMAGSRKVMKTKRVAKIPKRVMTPKRAAARALAMTEERPTRRLEDRRFCPRGRKDCQKHRLRLHIRRQSLLEQGQPHPLRAQLEDHRVPPPQASARLLRKVQAQVQNRKSRQTQVRYGRD